MADHLKSGEGMCCRVTAEPELKDEDETASTRKNSRKIVSKARLHSNVVQFQKGNVSDVTVFSNAVHNHHVSCHMGSCFECKKKGFRKRKHVCGSLCECRHRSPDAPELKAKMHECNQTASWFS